MGTQASTALARITPSLKLVCSLLIVGVLVVHVDLRGALESAQRISLGALGVVVTMFLAQHVIGALRLRITLRFLSGTASFPQVLRSQLVGAFFNQSFLTFVAGDGMRAWMLYRASVPASDAIACVFLDRVLGLVSLLLMVLLGTPWVLTLLSPEQRISLALYGTALGAGVGVLLCTGLLPSTMVRTRIIGWLREQGGRLLRLSIAWRSSGLLLALGVFIHALNILSIYALSSSLGLTLTVWGLASIIPAVLLASMVPISVGGWGVREGAMIVGLSLFGVDSEPSLVISVLFGLGIALTSLPGAAVWLRSRGRDADEAVGLGVTAG